MYKRREGTIVGVLIDFDLAILHGGPSKNTERIGTMPFMALDILASIIVANTDQLHLYRHDAESFLWVAIWVCGTYDGGKERQDAPFTAWTQQDAQHCEGLKLEFLRNDKGKLWSKGHQASADLLNEIRDHVQLDELKRTLQRLTIEKSGGVVQPEVTECPNTDYKRIDGNLFSTLRQKFGEK